MPKSPIELQRIIEKYGPAIEHRAKVTAKRFARPSGDWGFGYAVVHWEDVQQRVYETIVDKGITLAFLDEHPEPLGFIYKMCEHKAIAEAKNARAFGGSFVLTSFTAEDDTDPYGWIPDKTPDPSEYTPEGEVLSTEFDARVREVAFKVIGQLARISSTQAAESIELWALGGNTAKQVAEALGVSYGATTMAIRRGLLRLPPEDVATLHAVRAYFHPDVKKPKSRHLAKGATPGALLQLVKT